MITEEKETIRKALEGDERAFEVLYKNHLQRIYAIVARRTQNQDEVEDLVQVAFIRAFQGLSAFRGDAAFSTWLTRIAMNVCVSHYHSRRVYDTRLNTYREGVAGFPQVEDPEMAMLRKEARSTVINGIDSLPTRYRNAMWLRYVEEKSYDEIGSQLHIPMGTVKTWLYRGRELLGVIVLASEETKGMGLGNR